MKNWGGGYRAVSLNATWVRRELAIASHYVFCDSDFFVKKRNVTSLRGEMSPNVTYVGV